MPLRGDLHNSSLTGVERWAPELAGTDTPLTPGGVTFVCHGSLPCIGDGSGGSENSVGNLEGKEYWSQIWWGSKSYHYGYRERALRLIRDGGWGGCLLAPGRGRAHAWGRLRASRARVWGRPPVGLGRRVRACAWRVLGPNVDHSVAVLAGLAALTRRPRVPGLLFAGRSRPRGTAVPRTVALVSLALIGCHDGSHGLIAVSIAPVHANLSCTGPVAL